MTTLLTASDLVRSFRRHRFLARPDVTRAVQGVGLTLSAGTCLGIVGESGCGKSTLGRLLLGLLPPDGGHVTVLGARLDALSATELRQWRAEMALVHQNPLGALDPRQKLRVQIEEPLVIHRHLGLGRADRAARVDEVLAAVALDPALSERYPHRLSGGQRQRAVLARALVTRPKLMVLDEPVSALDVSVQAQILSLLQRLRQETGTGFVFISHDLRVVRQLADRVAVMYRGRIVETGSVEAVLDAPRHPYTQRLRGAVPRLTPGVGLQAEPPVTEAPPEAGCAFAPRCPLAQDLCREVVPPLVSAGADRQAACHFPNTVEDAA